MDSKSLATSAHKILKELGHEMPLGHVYELFSKLSGYASWNVAKTRDGFGPVLKGALSFAGPIVEGEFEVKVTASVFSGNNEIEIKKYYRVKAGNRAEAETIVENYIEYRRSKDEDLLRIPGVELLSFSESEDDFRLANWEVIYNETPIKVERFSSSNEVLVLKSLSLETLETTASLVFKVIEEKARVQEGLPGRFYQAASAILAARARGLHSGVKFYPPELAVILDAVGGLYASFDLGFKQGLIDTYSQERIEQIFKEYLSVLKEAESMGYDHSKFSELESARR